MRFLVFYVALWVVCCTAAKDITRTKKANGPDVVEAVIDAIQEKCVFEDDAQMLRKWARAASDDGRAPETFRSAFYGGIWQISEKQFLATKNENETLLTSIKSVFGIDWMATKWQDLLKPLYSGLAARLSMAPVPKDGKSQANSWSLMTGMPASQFKEAEESLIVSKCDITADILFLFDGSEQVGPENAEKMKTFMKEMIPKLNVGPDKTRIALEVLGPVDSSAFLFEQFLTEDETLDAVDRVIWPSSGPSYGHIYHAMYMFESGTRDWAPDISIFITAGSSNNYEETIRSSKMFLETGVKSFSIGVGPEANIEELSAFASDGDCNHLILLDNFDQLYKAASHIESRICKSAFRKTSLPSAVDLTSDEKKKKVVVPGEPQK